LGDGIANKSFLNNKIKIHFLLVKSRASEIFEMKFSLVREESEPSVGWCFSGKGAALFSFTIDIAKCEYCLSQGTP
jgi:hypothetical protein